MYGVAACCTKSNQNFSCNKSNALSTISARWVNHVDVSVGG